MGRILVSATNWSSVDPEFLSILNEEGNYTESDIHLEETPVSLSEQYDGVIWRQPHPPSADTLKLICHNMKPGSPLVVSVPILAESALEPVQNKVATFLPTEDNLKSALVFAGLVNLAPHPTSINPKDAAAVFSTIPEELKEDVRSHMGSCTLRGEKPAWNVGQSDMLDFGVSDDDELIDDDLLLDDADRKPVSAEKIDCSKSKSACANCSCGRKEREDAGIKDAAPPAGGCGSCGLGDAFRCGSCPFRGQPAFSTEKSSGAVTLNLDSKDFADDF
eukprot:TRINITY_DN5833_c0_g1_i1.p1 TRINITY_DN5833_c0_g1~~TRINITY_DN5833_c0_g1_i1.p1  ORF type:complete len:276 (-),score=62.12 TRINITY_DN5833_c0_g1_i1:73-900(-)